ncbi:MAG: SDR family oxidoreductase [Bacteroidota bacterium]
MIKDLEGKVAVVTGGAGILCSSLAESLANHGAAVAVLDLNQDAAEAVAASIINNKGKAIGLSADVLSKEALVEAHKRIKNELGTCDILINGAGGNHPKGTTTKTHLFKEDINSTEELRTFFQLDAEGVKFVFDLNFMGTLLPSQVFAQDMIGKKNCSIVNISSMNAFRPLTKIPAYSGAKAAISNFTQWLAVHFAPIGIRVNALAPGFFITDQNRSLLNDENGGLTKRGNTIIQHTPMGRFGKPNDLTGPLLWLCGEGSQFVTGTIIPIDGGFSAFSGV